MADIKRDIERKEGVLKLAFLGAPTVQRAGREVTFRTRKALALLVYLAVEGGVHTRDELATLFWPESDQSKGRASLRTTLSYLRRTLRGPSTAIKGTKKNGGFLIVERDTLSFNVEADFEADWLTLQKAWTAVRNPMRLPTPADGEHADEHLTPATLLAQLRHAANLYRGDFLTGFSPGDAPAFDNWASTHREQCHRQMVLVFDRLSQLQFECGELRDAIEAASRWVALDPLNEIAYRRLMQLHFAAEERSAALRAYEACQSALARELNADPAPETQALADRIRGFGSLDTRLRPDVSAAQLDTQHGEFLHLPLVGRSGEHLALATAYRAMRRGQPQIIILEGEPGIGKTRLASEFLGWAKAQGADVLQGRAFETGGRLPYQALVEALRDRLEQENAPEDLLADLWLTELSRLLPELRQRYPDLPRPSAEEETAQTRLFEAVARVCQALAERAPTILFLDDLQWADDATLDLLQYACRRWMRAGAAVLLLFTLRPEELAPDGRSSSGLKLRDWTVTMQRLIPMSRFTLDPLTEKDVIQLVQRFERQMRGEDGRADAELQTVEEDASPSPFDPSLLKQFARQLFAETGGQPFFLAETLRMLFEADRLPETGASSDGLESLQPATVDFEEVMTRYLQAGEGREIPPNVQEMIATRLGRLSSSARLLCLSAAVLGDAFDFERLHRVAGLREREALEALEALLNRGLIREQRQVVSHPYVLAHDHFRQVVYDRASLARRQLLHRHAFEVLTGAAAPAAEVARHAWAAGLFEQALASHVAAGEKAMRLYAPQAALAHFGRALEAAKRADIVPPPQLHLARGRAFEMVGDFEGAQLDLRRALAEAERRHDRQGQWQVLQEIGFLWAARDQARAGDYLRQALSLAQESGEPDMRARSLNRVGNWQANIGQPAEALALHQEALAIFEDLGQRAGQADTLDLLGMASYMVGNMPQSLAYYKRAVALFRDAGNRRGLVSSLAMMSLVMRATFTIEALPDTDVTESSTLAQSAVRTAREISWRAGESHALLAQGQLLYHQGQYAQASHAARRGLAAATEIEHSLWMTYGHCVFGFIHLDLLDLPEAQKHVEDALALSHETGSVFWRRSSTALLALVFIAQQKHGRAGAVLEEVLGEGNGGLQTVAWHEQTTMQRLLWYARAELALACHEPQLALQIVEKLIACAPSAAGGQGSLRLIKLRGEILTALGKTREAGDALQTALSLAAAQDEPPLLWRTHLALGRLYRQEQQDAEAAAQFSAALAIVEELASNVEDARLRERFRRSAGVPY